jgi:hypothetical protein
MLPEICDLILPVEESEKCPRPYKTWRGFNPKIAASLNSRPRSRPFSHANESASEMAWGIDRSGNSWETSPLILNPKLFPVEQVSILGLRDTTARETSFWIKG